MRAVLRRSGICGFTSGIYGFTLAFLLAVTGQCLLCSPVRADGSTLYEYSARGIALGSAVVARSPDPSAVAYNPALVSRLPGGQVQVGLILMLPHGKVDTWDRTGEKQTTSVKESSFFLPSVFYTQEINGRVSFGVGGFSRFGMGTEFPDSWPGRFNVQKIMLQTYSINPNLAFRVTDGLSLAVGLEALYARLDMKKRLQAGPYEVGSSVSGADDYGLGGNIAAHYKLNEHWAAGISYRSQVTVRAKGDVEFTNLNGMPQPVFDANFRNGEAGGKVTLPDTVSGGVCWTPVPELSVEAGATWTRWSTFRSLNISLPEPMDTEKIPRNWRSVWRVNLGVEYQATDWLALRAGYVYDQSPMTRPYADYFSITNGTDIFSAGFGLSQDAWTVDFAYARCRSRERSYSEEPRTNVPRSKSRNAYTDMFSVSVSYAF